MGCFVNSFFLLVLSVINSYICVGQLECNSSITNVRSEVSAIPALVITVRSKYLLNNWKFNQQMMVIFLMFHFAVNEMQEYP